MYWWYKMTLRLFFEDPPEEDYFLLPYLWWLLRETEAQSSKQTQKDMKGKNTENQKLIVLGEQERCFGPLVDGFTP